MVKYKILESEEQQEVCGIVLEQKVTEIAELYDFDFTDDIEQKIITAISEKRNGKCDGRYFIAKYVNEKYENCVGVLFGEITDDDNNYLESFLDGAEHDFRVACDMAHKNLTNKEKWKDIINIAEKYNLMDVVIDCINSWYYENEL